MCNGLGDMPHWAFCVSLLSQFIGKDLIGCHDNKEEREREREKGWKEGRKGGRQGGRE